MKIPTNGDKESRRKKWTTRFIPAGNGAPLKALRAGTGGTNDTTLALIWDTVGKLGKKLFTMWNGIFGTITVNPLQLL
jgi:hypothetical protein